MYISIIMLPILIISILCIFSRYISYKGVYKIINIMMLELIIIIIMLNYEIIKMKNIINIKLGIKYGILNINWDIILDEINSLMLLMIISITWIVIIYTYDYMIEDAHINRFYIYIIIFILSMTILITTSNLIIIFIGWEGVGLSSFLLISYWYTRLETNLGSLLALFMNRIGDIFYIMGILISYIISKSWDIIIINTININTDIFILCIFLAAITKSAQLYLHFWLPFSMEGPTPISALIHAATMVTAGVYILIRIQILINYSYYLIILICFIGSLTCFIGALLALTSLDMKEIIAYSTMSQLGYMITCIGLKLSNLAFFHLLFHAYFKALLFLTIGSILHTLFDIQDLRFSGSLFHFIPLSFIFLLFGLTSLIGLPFSTGYYSKENIIMMAYNNSFSSFFDLFLNNFVFILTLLSAFLTILYSYKLIYIIFLNTTRLSLFIFKYLHFYSLHLIFSLSFLSFITLFLGFFLFKWNLLLDLNFPFLNHNLSFFLKILPLFFFFLSFYFLHFIFFSSFSLSILSNQFYFKSLYLFISSQFINLSYRILFKLFDFGFYDLFFIFIPGNHIFLSLSNNLSHYLYSKYYLSFFLFSFFLSLSFFPSFLSVFSYI